MRPSYIQQALKVLRDLLHLYVSQCDRSCVQHPPGLCSEPLAVLYVPGSTKTSITSRSPSTTWVDSSSGSRILIDHSRCFTCAQRRRHEDHREWACCPVCTGSLLVLSRCSLCVCYDSVDLLLGQWYPRGAIGICCCGGWTLSRIPPFCLVRYSVKEDTVASVIDGGPRPIRIGACGQRRLRNRLLTWQDRANQFPGRLPLL